MSASAWCDVLHDSQSNVECCLCLADCVAEPASTGGKRRNLQATQVIYLCKSLLGESWAAFCIEDCPARLPGMFAVRYMQDTGYGPVHQLIDDEGLMNVHTLFKVQIVGQSLTG